MFPSRAVEGDRKTLPPISSLSSHPADVASRLPSRLDEPARGRRPPSALDHRQSPPPALLPHPSQAREIEPLRHGGFQHPVDEPFRPSPNVKLSPGGPPPFVQGHRDLERGSPASDEGAWRSYDRQDARTGAKDPYSPHMLPAAYAHRQDARSAPWQRPADDPHRPRLPAPPAAMREDGRWRSSGTSQQERLDVHSDAFAHDRAREDDRWRDERGATSTYHHESGPGFAPVPPYPHTQDGRRSFDADVADDGRRIRRRAGSGMVEDEHNAHRYPPPGQRPYGLGLYSPPESRSHSAAPGQPPMRAGMMVGMEPPRPNTSLGVTPSTPVPGNSQASSGTNTVNANRRVAHLLSEQKRRESINTGFEDLRQAIPACRDGQDSKATILKRALEYIRELEAVVERQHRLPVQGHALGGYSNRSPPDDKDDPRRFGRHGDEARRGLGGARQMTGGSNSSSGSNETGAGPRIGGLPSNAYGSAVSVDLSATAPRFYHTDEYRPYGPPRFPAAATNGAPAEVSRGAINPSNDVRSAPLKRYSDDSDEDQRLPSRRRVSDGDKDDVQPSPPRPNYTMTRPAPHPRSPMMRSPPIEKPRDWHARLENKSLVDSAVRV